MVVGIWSPCALLALVLRGSVVARPLLAGLVVGVYSPWLVVVLDHIVVLAMGLLYDLLFSLTRLVLRRCPGTSWVIPPPLLVCPCLFSDSPDVACETRMLLGKVLLLLRLRRSSQEGLVGTATFG